MLTAAMIVGATGLVGRAVIARAAPGALVALTRRGVPSCGQTMIVADPTDWPRHLEERQPGLLMIALGTTWRAAGRSEAGFRAVDQQLVLACARAARASGCRHLIAVSAVGADPAARNFYLRVKGEVEAALAALDFPRLDLIQPGLLRGARGADRRWAERIGVALSPISDALMIGRWADYRSIAADEVAAAMLTLSQLREPGLFRHRHAAIRALARG